MFLNFCDPRLRPEIKCSAISTDGYEVTNLISDCSKGFLAYSCIKPPIHIDITFICNIQINHILIWPSIGSQKSSGFQFYSRNTNDDNTPYTSLSSCYLNTCEAGLLLYPSDVDSTKISVPKNFLRRYIKASMRHLTTYTHSLRITICKTENSVPALGKIEVWGTVSPRCGKDVVASVHTLWLKQESMFAPSMIEYKAETNSISTTNNRQENETPEEAFQVPDESFLDAITWELMTQPVTLPSGKVIDQTTLEKHQQHEAIWGRAVSDPFTGVPFNEHRRPTMATALKMRIDKFLLENSNVDEIKKMPRVLGRNPTSVVAGDRRIVEVPKCVLSQKSLKRTVENAKLNVPEQVIDNNSQQTKRLCHRMPAVILYPRKATANKRSKQTVKTLNPFALARDNSHGCNRNDKSEILATDTDVPLDYNAKTLSPKIKRFNASEKIELHNVSNDCKCCDNSILYKLPCKHVICRKVLLSSIKNGRCISCGIFYKSSEVERIHDHISIK